MTPDTDLVFPDPFRHDINITITASVWFSGEHWIGSVNINNPGYGSIGPTKEFPSREEAVAWARDTAYWERKRSEKTRARLESADKTYERIDLAGDS